jgi:hypothetical protein
MVDSDAKLMLFDSIFKENYARTYDEVKVITDQLLRATTFHNFTFRGPCKKKYRL